MNITTPLQGTTTVVNQLDENIKVSVNEIVKYIKKIDEDYKKTMGEDFIWMRIHEIVRTNIEGNVNWKVS